MAVISGTARRRAESPPRWSGRERIARDEDHFVGRTRSRRLRGRPSPWRATVSAACQLPAPLLRTPGAPWPGKPSRKRPSPWSAGAPTGPPGGRVLQLTEVPSSRGLLVRPRGRRINADLPAHRPIGPAASTLELQGARDLARLSPQDDEKDGSMAVRQPPPPPLLKTRTRTLPGLCRHRRHAHLPLPAGRIKEALKPRPIPLLQVRNSATHLRLVQSQVSGQVDIIADWVALTWLLTPDVSQFITNTAVTG